MKNNTALHEAKAIVEELQSELGKIGEFALKYGSEAYWKKQHARYWLHGATDTFEAIELEKRLFDNPPATNTALINATRAVAAWKKWLKQQGRNTPALAYEHEKTSFFWLENFARLIYLLVTLRYTSQWVSLRRSSEQVTLVCFRWVRNLAARQHRLFYRKGHQSWSQISTFYRNN